MTGGPDMGREGIESYEKIFECQILDKYNLTDRKVPAVTVKGGYLRFNLNAIHLLNDTPFVELLINPDEKYMLVVPCGEFDVSAVDWCKVSKKTGRTESKDIRSKFFSPKLYNLMGWDANNSYKIQCFYQTFDNGIATINTETCEALGLDLETVKEAFKPYCTEIVEVTTQENF